jgi:hypothetical protein
MEVIEASRLDYNDLIRVLRGEAQVLRVSDFYDQQSAAQIAGRLEDSELRNNYANAPDVGVIGKPYIECQDSAESALEYEKRALSSIWSIRAMARPYTPPADVLRLWLDDIWPAGATLATIEGRRAFCGLVRIFGAGTGSEPHMDVLEWDLTQGEPETGLASQLAANIYCKMPDSGGELDLWPVSLTRPEYEELRIQNSYGVRVEELGLQPVCLRPAAGELILFNSRLVHAVRAGSGGVRVTSSCFVGFTNDASPLQLWS